MKKLAIFLVTFSLILLACGETQDTPEQETITEEAPAQIEEIEIETDEIVVDENAPGYHVRVINPDGSEFSGGLAIAETEVPVTLSFTWYDGSTAAFQGVGIEYGEDLIVVGTEGPMLRIYRKTNDGYQGVFFTGEELGVECISAELNEDPLPEPADIVALQRWPESFVFEVSGTNPDGSEYTGILQTEPLGAGAVVLWTHDSGTEIQGGALMFQDGTIVAAYSIGVVVYEVIEENIWRGEWYTPGSPALGVEWITPL